jgi:biotin transport system substrate-specific component
MKTRDLVLCALFVALITIGAFIRIPLPVVPFTMQMAIVILAGLLLGGKLGFFSVIIYVAMGLLGFPIFSEGGGIGYIFKPSFGYLMGFALAALVAGYIAGKAPAPSFKRLVAASFSGMAVIYLCGWLYCYWLSNFYLGTDIGLWPLFISCCVIFAPKDAICCILAAVIAKRLLPVVRKK